MSGISTGTAMLLSAGTSAVGSAASGFGQYEAGQQKRTAYDLNADQTSAEIEQKTANLVGKQASAYASSGVDISSGSPLLIMAATRAAGAKQAEEENAMMKYEGSMAAWSGTMQGIGTFLNGMNKSFSAYEGANLKTPSPTAQPSVFPLWGE